tara:strand:- start:29373 stop:30065 length:693 start_codon:yes stop_codon:yes gene_type:complete
MSTTYTELEDVVLAYLQDNVTVAEVFKGTTDPAVLTAKIKELILRAANNAKQSAQQMHNFVYDEVGAVAVIPAGSGLDLTSLTDTDSAEVFELNVLTEVMYNGWPIALSSRGAYNKLLYKQGQVNRVTGVRQRNMLKLIPAQDVNVDVEVLGYRKLAPYSVTVTTDWLLDEGFEYLQWATICEVNHLVQVYLGRAEGTLPPPTKSRDVALEKLIRWDVDMLESNYTTNIL